MPQNMLFFRNEKHQKTQAHELDFQFRVTGATTFAAYPVGQDIFAFNAAITQQNIDDYLGTSGEFTAAKFDATSMGADAFGGIIQMNGQCQQLIGVAATFATGTNNATVISRSSLAFDGMADSALGNSCAVSTLGNIGFKFILTGYDAATTGLITLKVRWVSK